jgi:hypothetical protein
MPSPNYVCGCQRSLVANGVGCLYPLATFTVLLCMHLYGSGLLPSRLIVPTSAEDVGLDEVVVWPVVASVVM